MPHAGWRQAYIDEVPPIVMREPLAELLGAVDEGRTIEYTFADCVKLAGHACLSVSAAYRITQEALAALYPGEVPQRGGLHVTFLGIKTEGANGPMAQVMQYLTGAAMETGFHGLAGRHARDNRFAFDALTLPGGIAAVFTRDDTGAAVRVTAHPERVQLSAEEMEGGRSMQKVIGGAATSEEREKFYAFWHGRNRAMLLGPGIVTVERLAPR